MANLEQANKDALYTSMVEALENFQKVGTQARRNHLNKNFRICHDNTSSPPRYSLYQHMSEQHVEIKLCKNAIVQAYSLVLSSADEKEGLREQISHLQKPLTETEVKLLIKMATYFAVEEYRGEHAELNWYKLLKTNCQCEKAKFRATLNQKEFLRSLAKSFVSVDASVPVNACSKQTTKLLEAINGKVLGFENLRCLPEKSYANPMSAVGSRGIAMKSDFGKALRNVQLDSSEIPDFQGAARELFRKALGINNSSKIQVQTSLLESKGSATRWLVDSLLCVCVCVLFFEFIYLFFH